MKPIVAFAALLAPLLAPLVAMAPAHARPEPRAILPAMGALEVEGTLALWAPDLRSVLGHSLSGERLWRLATGDQGGLRDLEVLGDKLLVYAGAEAILVAPDTGKVLGRRADVRLRGPGQDPLGTCRVHAAEGACALRCACSFELVSCETLAAIGPRVSLPSFEEIDPEGARSAHCPMFSGALLGRAGDALIASTPAVVDKAFFGVPEVVVARSARDGSELWRNEGFGRFDEGLSGVAADGRTCFIGRRSGSMTVFDCQRATVLWERKLSILKGVEPQVESVSATGREVLVVRDGHEAHALDLITGASVWRASLPDSAAFLFDPPVPTRRFGVKVESAQLLDPGTGRVLAELPLPPGTRSTPERTPWGWLAVGEQQVETFDDQGRALGGWKTQGITAALAAPGVLAFSSPDALRVVAPRPEAASLELLALPLAGARPIALSSLPDGKLALALYRDGKRAWDPKNPDSFGEVQVFALTR